MVEKNQARERKKEHAKGLDRVYSLASFPSDPASLGVVGAMISNAENQSAASINNVPELALVLANPPTTSDLQELLDTVNLIITTARR